MIISPESTTRELVIESSNESRMIQVPECTQSHGGFTSFCEKKQNTQSVSFVNSNHHSPNHNIHHHEFNNISNNQVILSTKEISSNEKLTSSDNMKISSQMKKDEDLNLGKCSKIIMI